MYFYRRESSFISSCNSDCGCSTAGYEPVCDHNQIVYFSPCHAGCAGVSVVNGTKVLASSQRDCKYILLVFPRTVLRDLLIVQWLAENNVLGYHFKKKWILNNSGHLETDEETRREISAKTSFLRSRKNFRTRTKYIYIQSVFPLMFAMEICYFQSLIIHVKSD